MEERAQKKALKDMKNLNMKKDEAPDYGDLVRGLDIIDDKISTAKAFDFFRELEERD